MSHSCLNDEELLHAIALSLIPDVGPIVARRLIGACGNPKAVFIERKGNLLKIPGISRRVLGSLSKADMLQRAEAELNFIRRRKVSVHYFLSPGYPTRLRQCADAPILLYALGNPPLEAPRVLAVVGTRRSTPYGEQVCRDLVHGLSNSGVLIVSGLAYGIDAVAHRSALECGLETVAVLGHGLDRIYPGVHTQMAKQMLRQGGLISDFPSGTKPDRNNFPSRNRIIAGLCDAVLVIEAASKGGALITADLAVSYDREVMAVPGRVDDALSEGCNQLIHSNKAALVCDARQVLDWMGWDSDGAVAVQARLFDELNNDEQMVVELLRACRECSLDSLAIQSNLGVVRMTSLLFEMEIKGVVRSLPGKIYRLN